VNLVYTGLLIDWFSLLYICGTIQGGPKTDIQFYFWDNFGNSAPILTIIAKIKLGIRFLDHPVYVYYCCYSNTMLISKYEHSKWCAVSTRSANVRIQGGPRK